MTTSRPDSGRRSAKTGDGDPGVPAEDKSGSTKRAETSSHVAATLRVDVWLWRARFFKTRSLAAKAVSAGTIRVDRNGTPTRLDKPAAPLRAGDVISFARPDGRVRVVEVMAFGEPRGPATEAAALYIDHTPPAPPAAATPPLAERKGRPTKKDRRAIDRLTGEGAV